MNENLNRAAPILPAFYWHLEIEARIADLRQASTNLLYYVASYLASDLEYAFSVKAR